MTIFCCRLCKSPLLKLLIKTYPFPKAAQFYPTRDEFNLAESVELDIRECEKCGLVQLTNYPVDYYKSVITAATLSTTLQENRLNLFNSIYKKITKKEPIALEIGCGFGANIALMQQVGFVASGIEYTQANYQNESIRKIYYTELDESEAEKYDLVVSFNYLEHQPDQENIIKKIY